MPLDGVNDVAELRVPVFVIFTIAMHAVLLHVNEHTIVPKHT